MRFAPKLSIRVKLAILAGVPVVGALLLALFVAHDARQRAASAASLGSIEDLARLTSYMTGVLHAIEDERAVGAARCGLETPARAGRASPALSGPARETDLAAARLEAFLSTRDRTKLPPRLARGLLDTATALAGLPALRARVEGEPVPLQELLTQFGTACGDLVGATAALSELSDDGIMLRNISAIVALLELEERSSVEQAIVSYTAARSEFPPGAYKTLVTTTTEETVFDQAFRTSAPDDVRAAFSGARDRGRGAREILDAVLRSTEDTVSLDGVVWSTAQAAALRELRNVEGVLLGRIETAAAVKGAELRKTIRLSVGVSVAVIFLSVGMAVFVGRGVQGSVSALTGAAEKVRSSRDFSVRARRVSDDELGMLTETFNDMLAGIQSRDVELEQHRSHLEGLVVARTRELAARNGAMRLVLDNVDQGLATIGPGGALHPERSGAFDRWFGSSSESRPFHDALAPADDGLSLMLKLGWAQVVDGILPVEVSAEQLPKRFDLGNRHFTLAVKVIVEDAVVVGGLLVVSDVTGELEARKEQARQKEEIQIFRRIARDKAAFLAFLEETGSLVQRLRDDVLAPAEQLALVHTVKGNAAQYEVRSVAEAAHELETAILEAHAALPRSAYAPFFAAWDALADHVAGLVGAGDSKIELSQVELEGLIHGAVAGLTNAQVVARLQMLFDEPVATRFARLGDHAERLASRLGKPVPALTFHSDGLRLPRDRYAPFWAALVHVVRNAVDHGIEDAAGRAAAGKPARGNMTFRARTDDASVVIEIGDDGAGIDWGVLGAKARAAGLPATRREDVERALFASGISSLEKATDVSGRGVGLAAVWDTTRRLGGTVKVESVRGGETRFVFRLPLERTNGDAS